MWSRYDILLLRFVIDHQDIKAAIKLIDELTNEDKISTLFLVPSEKMKDVLVAIGVSSNNIGILHESLYKTLTRDIFMVTSLYFLSSHGKKIYTIPLSKVSCDISFFKVNNT